MAGPEQEPVAFQKLPANIADEMRQSYMDYAMSVIIGRALPDVRDGLKPANRRVLFGMQQMGLLPGRPYRKSAKVAGEVMGNYHPHGEGAIYDTLVRMAQDWNLRAPLADGQGNFGSVDGDPPAAMRYTEVRLSRVGASMMADIEKDTVDFIPTYDNSATEPTVLPTVLPNLLVNGAEGITVVMRARAEIETRKGDKESIVVTEIPYQVNKARLVERIAELVREKRIDGIADIRDESSREGMRIVLDVRKGEPSQVILNNLYKLTPLQDTFGIIMLAIVD